eukprot:CAMPEP_0179104524 /NCGR_PEP_ID=MMETSP0796-20121207/48491_1 /TAXON_ID=73915 /ORGANISM="Pyrodinium bahamense, Strain pbaha01" /LENGTH=182 /DNA_ID=CAMNT_0020802471 /DNA_START=415 /DNA_END=963 /DNA_ORIENTATION=+
MPTGVAAAFEAPLVAHTDLGNLLTGVKGEARLADIEGCWVKHGLLAVFASPYVPCASCDFLTEIASDKRTCQKPRDKRLMVRDPGPPTRICGLQQAEDPNPAAHPLQLAAADAEGQPPRPALRHLRLLADTCPRHCESVATVAFSASCHGGTKITEHLDLHRLRFPIQSGPPVAGGRAVSIL